jgi:hypothetical protein
MILVGLPKMISAKNVITLGRCRTYLFYVATPEMLS